MKIRYTILYFGKVLFTTYNEEEVIEKLDKIVERSCIHREALTISKTLVGGVGE